MDQVHTKWKIDYTFPFKSSKPTIEHAKPFWGKISGLCASGKKFQYKNSFEPKVINEKFTSVSTGFYCKLMNLCWRALETEGVIELHASQRVIAAKCLVQESISYSVVTWLQINFFKSLQHNSNMPGCYLLVLSSFSMWWVSDKLRLRVPDK
jgi:hypothetical protein